MLSDKESANKLLRNLCVKYKNIGLKTCTVSIIKVFLSMSEVQYELVDTLLRQLTKLSVSQTEEDVQLFDMILIQFNEYKNVKHKLQLVNKVLHILEKTEGHMREKSVKMIEILVPRRKQSFFVQKLIEFVPDTEELCKQSFIETYIKLNLENDILSRLRIKMLDYLKQGAQKKVSTIFCTEYFQRGKITKKVKKCFFLLFSVFFLAENTYCLFTFRNILHKALMVFSFYS